MNRVAVGLFGGVSFLGSLLGGDPSCPSRMVPTGQGTCIDQFEWPGDGRKPVLGASALPETEAPRGVDADTVCRSVGKRVCEREEWVSACLGPDATPFPYGGHYEAKACNDARWWKTVDEVKIARRDKQELARLDGSEPGGSRPECRSPTGAFDMVGNVEEWVRCSEGEYGWCLVGGYWASRGSRSCKSAITKHAPRWHYYQTGFRCCSAEKGERE
jgi:formylglycine-generating enzyme required for sulfatase activity